MNEEQESETVRKMAHFLLLFHFSLRQSPLPLSFFAPKPNGNGCYAGYVHDKGYRVYAFLLYTKYKRKQL